MQNRFRSRFVPLAAALAVLGAALLVAAELSPLLEVRAGDVVVERQTTGTHHSYAQLVVALAALGMAWGALRSTPAVVALLALGLVSLAISFVVDLPDTRATGLTMEFEDASAEARLGLWLELAGGGALVVAGLLGLLGARSTREEEGAGAVGAPPGRHLRPEGTGKSPAR